MIATLFIVLHVNKFDLIIVQTNINTILSETFCFESIYSDKNNLIL